MSSRSRLPDLSPLALLRTLSDLISKNISVLESTNVAVPDLDAPFHPESEAFRSLPDAAEAANIISAAALHLAAVLVPPQVTLYHAVGGHFKSAAIRACLESNVTEILREAGPKGLSVEKISAINGQDPQKIGRFLRILATNHVYREVEPDVFTNNRISSMLDTLKPVSDILSDSQHKHDGTFGLAALAGHHLDEAFKASAYSWETLADPLTSLSGDEKRPDALVTGRVELEVHDFFDPQPETRKAASVYFLKQVLHDWSDEYCVKILSHLHDAAQITTTKLVLMESIMPFACLADIHGPEGASDTGPNGNVNVNRIPGAVAHEAPLPLLANYGIVNEMGYNADIDMFLLFNSQERTIKHMVELLRSTGWEVVMVHRQSGGDSTFVQGIEAIPDSQFFSFM